MMSKLMRYGCPVITAVLLIAVLGAGAASAEDTVVTASTWNELNTSVSDWKLTDTMRTIVLTNTTDGAYTNATLGGNYIGIPVFGNVTIKPAATKDITIDAKQTGRIFCVYNGGSLTLEGNTSATLTLTGGNLTGYLCGAGIEVDGGNLTFSDGVMLDNCSAEYNGGGVYVHDGGKFMLTGGRISNCTLPHAISDNGYGGGIEIYMNSIFIMTGGDIIDCAALNGGGIDISGDCTALMTGGNITNCYAEEIGGGVSLMMNSTLTLSGGTISNCQANTFNYGGGGVCVSVDCEFIMNGGEIIRCTSTARGGGVSLEGDGSRFTLSGGRIADCNAGNWGGGVFNFGTCSMTGGTIDNCSAYYGGGVFNYLGILFTLSGGTIGNCRGTAGGGGIEIYTDSAFVMTGGDIIDCVALTGGGIEISANCTALMTGGNITGCIAEKNGGGIYISDNSTALMTGGNITDCSAEKNGGGIDISDNCTIMMTGGNITGCIAEMNGGGIDISDNCTASMTGGKIMGNTAMIGPGVFAAAILNLSSSAVISDTDAVAMLDDLSHISAEYGFSGRVGNITLWQKNTSESSSYEENPRVWAGKVVISDVGDAIDNFSLSSANLYKGFRLNKSGNDAILDTITTRVIPSSGVAVFGNDNYTVIRSVATASKILLENVSKVNNTVAVNFTTDDSTVTLPQSLNGLVRNEEISIFTLEAMVNETDTLAEFNVTITFKDAPTASANKGKIIFLHYNGHDSWSKLSSSIMAENGAEVTYTVKTLSFSPFGIGIYTNAPVLSSSSSSRNSGYTVILPEEATVPTSKPTVVPTNTPELPVVLPTTQPTQKSPAPLAGLIVGLGMAALLYKLRK